MSNAIVKSPPTILIHFHLEDIEHVTHFTIIQQLLAKYYIKGESKLQVMDIPFNITNEQSLDKWNVEAAKRLRGISCYEHVVVFVTTHSNPDRGDLWARQNSPKNCPKDPCAITVKNVSCSLFFFSFCMDIDHELNSGSKLSSALIRPYSVALCSFYWCAGQWSTSSNPLSSFNMA